MRCLLIVMLLLLSTLASAEVSMYFAKNSLIDIKEPCVNAQKACSNNATCNLTVSNPDSTLFINAQPMTNKGNYFNYTLPSSNVSGQYKAIVYCEDGGQFGYDAFTFEINDNGKQTNDYAFILGIGIVAALLITIGLFLTTDAFFSMALKLACFLFALLFILLIPASFTSFEVKALSYGLFIGYLITVGMILGAWGAYIVLAKMGVVRGN